MDPDECLRRINERVGELLDDGSDLDESEFEYAAEDLAALVRSLDHWLRSGGYPPRVWNVKIHMRLYGKGER
jgi:hypothetical protein